MNTGRAALGILLLAIMSGCTWIYPTVVPIPTQDYPVTPATVYVPARQADTLLILLPGRGDDVESFDEHGFIDDVRASGAQVDIVTVDAHLGYYLSATLVSRIWDDVIAPARARGYRHIWMAGVSMGGLGSLVAAQDHPGAIEGLILLAPYLGTSQVLGGIEREGGAAQWTETDPTDRYQQLWTWLKQYRNPYTRAAMPKIVLAFGSRDRFRTGHRLLAGLLDPQQVTEIPGAHNWTTWRKLWRAYWLPGGNRTLALARR